MIDETQLVKAARKMQPHVWYTGVSLNGIWRADTAKRKALIAHLKKRCMVSTKGKTTTTKYKVRSEKDWRIKAPSVLWPVIEKTGNGVIDAKLRKEAGVPEKQTSLDNLVAAATVLGTENGIMRNKLDRIKAILDEV